MRIVEYVLIGLLIGTLIATAADANTVGVQAGGSKSWVSTDSGSSWEELTSPLAGLSYDVVLDTDGYYGLSFALRASQDNFTLTQYGVEYWRMLGNAAMEWYAGAQMESWDVDGTQFLFGPRAGVRFDVGGAPFEVSGYWSGGADQKRSTGLFFGLRATSDLGGGGE